jgi:hypothetical protein
MTRAGRDKMMVTVGVTRPLSFAHHRPAPSADVAAVDRALLRLPLDELNSKRDPRFT